MFGKPKSQRNIAKRREARKRSIEAKLEKLPKIDKRKVTIWSMACISALNFFTSTGSKAFANESQIAVNNLNQTEQSLPNNVETTNSINPAEMVMVHEIENQIRKSEETLQSKIDSLNTTENTSQNNLPANFKPSIESFVTPESPLTNLTSVSELEDLKNLENIETLNNQENVKNADSDVQAFLDNKNITPTIDQSTEKSEQQIQEILPDRIDMDSDVDTKTKERLQKIKDSKLAGFKEKISTSVTELDPNLGGIKNFIHVVNSTGNIEIIDNGDEYPTIKTTATDITLADYYTTEFIKDTTTTEIVENHLTFEITGLRQNENGEYENIVGSRPSYINPDGTFNPNTAQANEQRQAEFNRRQNGDYDIVPDSFVEKFLEPGITSRADLEGISSNISTLVSSQVDTENTNRNIETKRKKRQTIGVSQTKKSISGDDSRTKIIEQNYQINIPIDDHYQIKVNREYVEKNTPINTFQPKNDFLSKGQFSIEKLRGIARDSSENSNDESGYKKFRKSQIQSIIEAGKNVKSTHPKYSPVIDKRTPTIEPKVLEKTANLARTATTTPTIGFKKSIVTSTKDSSTGVFTGFDAGLHTNRDLEITTTNRQESSNFTNIFRAGGENDNPGVQTTINGLGVDNSSFLFGIIAGLDRRTVNNQFTVSYDYFDRNVISVGASGGITNNNSYASSRISLNQDLYSNTLYPQIKLNAGTGDKSYGVSASLNLSTNPTFFNPNEVNIGGFWNFAKNKSRSFARIYTNSKFGLGKNHDLYRDKAVFGMQVFPSKKLTINFSHSPELTEKSQTETSAGIILKQKKISHFGGVNFNKSGRTINAGLDIKTGKRSNLKISFQNKNSQFGIENIGTIQYIQGL